VNSLADCSILIPGEGRFVNAEGVSKFQPRVARASALPWVTTKTNRRNPERVAEPSAQTPIEFVNLDQPGFTVDLVPSDPDSEESSQIH
jgi:hypothetical protein